RVLNAMGPEAQRTAIPIFVRVAGSSDAAERDVATWALFSVDAEHANQRLVVPALVNALADTNFVIRLLAATCLGDFGANAQPAVPVLVRLLNDPTSRVRPDATNALRKIDPEAAARAGVKPKE